MESNSASDGRNKYRLDWRHTFSSPRFFMFDARILIFFVVAILWISKVTFFLAVLATFIVWVAEIKNKMSIGAFFRFLTIRAYDNVFIPLTGSKTVHGDGWRSNRPYHKINKMTDKDAWH